MLISAGISQKLNKEIKCGCSEDGDIYDGALFEFKNGCELLGGNVLPVEISQKFNEEVKCEYWEDRVANCYFVAGKQVDCEIIGGGVLPIKMTKQFNEKADCVCSKCGLTTWYYVKNECSYEIVSGPKYTYLCSDAIEDLLKTGKLRLTEVDIYDFTNSILPDRLKYGTTELLLKFRTDLMENLKWLDGLIGSRI